MFRFFPNFSIRLIDALEELVSEGHLSQEELKLWVGDNEYKDLNFSLFQIVSYFRATITGERETDTPHRSYKDFAFPDDQCEFSLEDPDFDSWIKETVMIGIHSVLKHLKSQVEPTEAFQIFENLKFVLKTIFSNSICPYVLRQVFTMVKLLVQDRDCDILKLNCKEKTIWLMKIINSPRLKELNLRREDPDNLVN